MKFRFSFYTLLLVAILEGYPFLSNAQIPQLSPLRLTSVEAGGLGSKLGVPAVAQLGTDLILESELNDSTGVRLQWWLDGEALNGATNNTLRIPKLERMDEGRYWLTASNATGEAATPPAQLRVANLRPLPFLSLRSSAPTGTAIRVDYADALASPTTWKLLTNFTLTSSPVETIDFSSAGVGTRFYRVEGSTNIVARHVPGWTYLDSTGTVHQIEYLETPGIGSDWKALRTLTLSTFPSLFVDTTVAQFGTRSYRTTRLSTPSSRLTGRLVFAVRWKLPVDVYASLQPSDKVAMRARGVTFDDEQRSLNLGTNALPGYWVVLGEQRTMSDTNGNFTVDLPPGVSSGVVVARYRDRSNGAQVSFPVSRLTQVGDTPVPILVPFELSGELNMDGSASGPAGAPGLASIGLAEVICGNPGVHVGNTRPCCLDYNGYIPTDCKGNRPLPEMLTHYVGSTCQQLVSEGLCAREWNALQLIYVPFPPFVVPFAPLVGPSCFENHKYRNCQNIDRTLSLTPDVQEISSGGTVVLTIHNNTWANETILTVPAGQLHGNQIASGTGIGPYEVRHWTDTPNRIHVTDTTVTFNDISRSPPGSTLTFVAEAGGQRISTQVKIKSGLASVRIRIPSQAAGSIWTLPADVQLELTSGGSKTFTGSNNKLERGFPLYSTDPRTAGATFYKCDKVVGFPPRVSSNSPFPNRVGGSSFVAIVPNPDPQAEREFWVDASVGAFRISGEVTFNWEYQIRYYSGRPSQGIPPSMTIGSVPNSDSYSPTALTSFQVELDLGQ